MKSTGIVAIECDGPIVLEEEMFGFSAPLISGRAALSVVGIDSGLIIALLELALPGAVESS